MRSLSPRDFPAIVLPGGWGPEGRGVAVPLLKKHGPQSHIPKPFDQFTSRLTAGSNRYPQTLHRRSPRDSTSRVPVVRRETFPNMPRRVPDRLMLPETAQVALNVESGVKAFDQVKENFRAAPGLAVYLDNPVQDVGARGTPFQVHLIAVALKSEEFPVPFPMPEGVQAVKISVHPAPRE